MHPPGPRAHKAMSVVAILLSAAASSTAFVTNDLCGAAGAEAHSASGLAASHGAACSCGEGCSPHGVDEPWGPIEDEALAEVSLLHVGTSLKLGLQRGSGSGGGSGAEDAPRSARDSSASSVPTVLLGTSKDSEPSPTAAGLPIGDPPGKTQPAVPGPLVIGEPVLKEVPPAKVMGTNSLNRLLPLPPLWPAAQTVLQEVGIWPMSTIGKVWNTLTSTSRYHRWSRGTKHRQTSPLEFFTSATFIDWAFFVLALGFFFGVYVALMHWPSTSRFHGTALLIWLGMALAYNFVIWRSLGPDEGRGWFVGYVLEFVFSIENVFIYHRVSSTFRIPRVCAQKALVVVVVCQVLFQMFFFMGLAQWLQSLLFLPYVVGVWLLYVAYHSLAGEEEHKSTGKTSLKEVSDPPVILKCFKYLLGKRFIATYRGRSVLVVDNGILCMTALGPATLCLLLVSFIMEIDVTLTKIQEIPNNFVAFTSSMAAAFAVPELFFVAQDLFNHFRFLKYGVALMLVFFSLQLLLHEVLAIPELVDMIFIVVNIAACMLLSRLIQEPEPDLSKQPLPGNAGANSHEREEDEEGEASWFNHGSAQMNSTASRSKAHTM